MLNHNLCFFYRLISLLFNPIYYAKYNYSYWIFKKKEKKRDVLFLSRILTLNILIENFLHSTKIYIYWVIKSDKTYFLRLNKTPINVWGFLAGSPSNYKHWYLQGFLLIFFSMSQDFIFFSKYGQKRKKDYFFSCNFNFLIYLSFLYYFNL